MGFMSFKLKRFKRLRCNRIQASRILKCFFQVVRVGFPVLYTFIYSRFGELLFLLHLLQKNLFLAYFRIDKYFVLDLFYQWKYGKKLWILGQLCTKLGWVWFTLSSLNALENELPILKVAMSMAILKSFVAKEF